MVSMATASFTIRKHRRDGKNVRPEYTNCFEASVNNDGIVLTLVGFDIEGRKYEVTLSRELVSDIALHHSAAGLNK
jgi:hypothetical protein